LHLVYKRTAMKALRRMPENDRKALVNKLDDFVSTGEGDVKKLQGRPEYRLRHGQWRAILEISDGVCVLSIAHRSGAY